MVRNSRKLVMGLRIVTSSVGVATPLPNKECLAREQMPNTFLIYDLSKLHYQILTQQTVWASSNITFRVISPTMNCPMFMFAIKGLCSLEPTLVRAMVRDLWNDETTSKFIRDGLQAMDDEARSGTAIAIQNFLDSMKISLLKTCGSGAAAEPTFNIYMNSSLFDDVTSWSNLRTHLVNRKYHSNKLGRGYAVIAPYHCGLCHGVDHPRGMCPFPDIEGWRGPKERREPINQKRGPNNRNSAKASCDRWN